MSDRWRISSVAVCCLLASISPFVAGISTAVVGVVLVLSAVVLIGRSSWSSPTRLVASVAAVGGTLGLTVAFLILASLASGD